MKKLIAILAICLLPGVAWGATYYACIAGNIDAANAWEDAVGCDGTTFTYGAGGFPASGSILEANAQSMAINVDPGPNGKVHLKNTAGSGFTLATASGLTVNADITGVGARALLVTGSTAGTPVVTIIGNITGSSTTASADGVYDTHTFGTVQYTGTITGGRTTTAYGLNHNSAGPISITGAIIGGTQAGFRSGSTGTVTVNGSVTGGDGASAGHGIYMEAGANISITGDVTGGSTTGSSGVYAFSTGTATITGNLLNTVTSDAARGRIVWNPSGSGTNWNYIRIVTATAGPTYGYLTLVPAVTKVKVGETYGFDGATYYTGTLAGGGAWAQ